MALLLGVSGSPRPKGNSAALLREAFRGAAEVEGVEAEQVRLYDYEFGPCTACGKCVRGEEHVCILPDDMGLDGEGELFKKLRGANAMLVANPTYCWGVAAKVHLFMERIYPFVWSGELMGMPFASISVATNQGMQRQAESELCRWACAKGWRHIGSLPVHRVVWQEMLPKARELGRRLAEAALADEREGRKKLSEEECFLLYLDKPWDGLEQYLDNLTDGTGDWEHSLIKRALDARSYESERANEYLRVAGEELRKALERYGEGDREGASIHLAHCSSYWTRATWGGGEGEPPPVYKPLPERHKV